MKKIVLLLLAFVTYQNVFAVTNMYNWRWRKDDGSETTATWAANENATIVLSNSNDKFRLRCEIVNQNTDAQYDNYNIGNDTLLYSTSKSGPWIPILPEAGDRAFMLAGTSTAADLTPTTEQLSRHEATFTFEPGVVIVSSSLFSKTLALSKKTEFEGVIKGTANTKPFTKYYFVPSVQNIEFTDHPTYANLQTSATLPISLANFSVSAEGQAVKLLWTTANEQNNDRFEILRSADGRTNWKVIGTVKGNGTTSKSSNYSFTDINPLNGNNYYRLKQYDFDGKFNESDIKYLSRQLSKALMNVFPNPTKGMIQFTLTDYTGGNITAQLSDMTGKLIHRTIIQPNTNNSYKLNLSNNLKPGIYIFKIIGDGVDNSMQVQIQ